MKVVDYKNENLATIGGRAAAAILDAVFLTIIVVIIHFTCGTWAWVIELITALHYDLGMHILRGATLGQSLLNIQVVSLDGGTVSLWQNIVRYFSKGFSALPLGMGFFLAARDSRRMAWHDKLAGTCVVLRNAAPNGFSDMDRTSLAKTGLFLSLFCGFVLSVVGIVLLALGLVSKSEAYEPVEEAIRRSSVIADSVGTISDSRMTSFRFTKGPQGTIGWYLTLVRGSRASAIIATTVVKDEDAWRLKFIGYSDSDGKVVSLQQHGKDRASELAKNGDTYYEAKVYDSAINAYSKAIEYDSSCAAAWFGRCGAYFSKGRYRDEIADGTQAVLLDPKSRWARYRRGLSCQEAGFYQRALQDFEYLVRVDPEDKRAYFNKAKALDSLGRRREAAFNYKEFLRLADVHDSIFVVSALYRIEELESIQ